uniref:Uncharacterized protein n=1 Tax=Wuchereria bancrofti TaxID=6293 RepID=A0A1I8EWD7_WUCBA
MAVLELRKWLHTMSEKLSILQLQIETEGHTLVNNVQRTVTRYEKRFIEHLLSIFCHSNTPVNLQTYSFYLS